MLNRQQGKFTIVLNEIINNPKLSAKAKGVYLYLQSKGEDWQFYESEIIQNFTDGKASIRTALKELQKHHLLLKYQKHNKGKGFNNSTWILNPTKEDIALYCEEFNADRFYADINNADINNADIKTATNKTNNNKTNNIKTNSTQKERNFKKFKEHFIYSNPDPFTTSGLGYLKTTKLAINKAGYITNTLNSKILTAAEAMKIWNYLYEKHRA